MNKAELEQKLKESNLLTVYDKDHEIKHYVDCGKLINNGKGSSLRNTFGVKSKNQGWIAFVNDAERGVPTYIKYCANEEEACECLFHKIALLDRIVPENGKRRKKYAGNLVNSGYLAAELSREILNGVKTPHSTSQPVIYQENGEYYLAVFVFFYTRDDIRAGAVDRPTVWAIAELKNGTILSTRETSKKDFSDAPYDVKYDIRADAKYDTSKEYYDQAFAILDSVREKLVATGDLPGEEYSRYLEKIIANIPKAYQRFYYDLSV